MITANVVHRIFRIKVGESEGTAFTIDVGDREYLITAKHVVDNISEEQDIQLFSNGKWIDLHVHLVGHASSDVDISVLATRTLLTPANLPMPATSNGVIYGQDVHFLGFPYGYLGKYSFGAQGYPLPFVKRATVSLLDDKLFLLDGHNNPGFSGGPVVFRRPNEHQFSVAAVVSGYRYVDEPIHGSSEAGQLTYQYNTGIVEAYSIDLAFEPITARPIGCPIKYA